MATVIDRSVIEKLSVDERLALVDLIWDTITKQSENFPMSDATYEEFMRRLEEARANPDDGMSPAEFAETLRSRRK